MPSFDLRYIQAAEYLYNSATKKVTHGEAVKVGDAMTASLEVRRAEGRLYAEGSLAEFMAMITGGVISLGVKYITDDAQKLLYGFVEHSRKVGEKQIKGLRLTGTAQAKYVSVSFYAPDVIDGTNKYTCVYVARSLFGPPSYSFQTKGQNLTFNTPTTSGEFLKEHSDDEVFIEVAVCDTVDEAKEWCDLVLTDEVA